MPDFGLPKARLLTSVRGIQRALNLLVSGGELHFYTYDFNLNFTSGEEKNGDDCFERSHALKIRWVVSSPGCTMPRFVLRRTSGPIRVPKLALERFIREFPPVRTVGIVAD